MGFTCWALLGAIHRIQRRYLGLFATVGCDRGAERRERGAPLCPLYAKKYFVRRGLCRIA